MTTTAKPIQIFRSGEFTSMEGQRIRFTDADLRAAAEAYDPAEPAPLVVGHPKTDDPAYGWVAGLTFADGKLYAQPDQVEPAFGEAVNAGRYKRISPQWYLPRDPNNPQPGKLILKHVGFLGAKAPAVRGIAHASFAQDELAATVTFDLNFEFQENTVIDNPTPDDATASFAEREQAISTREAELEQREQAIADREREAAEAAAATAHAGNVSFAEGLAAAGKLKPFGKVLVTGLLDQLDALPAPATASFGEADGEAPITPSAALRKLLESGDQIVSFAEVAADPNKGKTTVTVSFAAPAGHVVDPTALATHERALELQAADPNLSYLDAVRRAG